MKKGKKEGKEWRKTRTIGKGKGISGVLDTTHWVTVYRYIRLARDWVVGERISGSRRRAAERRQAWDKYLGSVFRLISIGIPGWSHSRTNTCIYVERKGRGEEAEAPRIERERGPHRVDFAGGGGENWVGKKRCSNREAEDTEDGIGRRGKGIIKGERRKGG